MEYRSNKATHLRLHVLRVVLPIDITIRSLRLVLQRRIAHLCGQAILEIKEAGLANILDFCAGLTDDGGLETHA